MGILNRNQGKKSSFDSFQRTVSVTLLVFSCMAVLNFTSASKTSPPKTEKKIRHDICALLKHIAEDKHKDIKRHAEAAFFCLVRYFQLIE